MSKAPIFSEQILFSAFRYALGRQTYIVETTVANIIQNWDFISPTFKHLIKKEILEARHRGSLSPTDSKEWDRILELK